VRCGGPGRGWPKGGDVDLERNTPGDGMSRHIQDFCLCPACGTEILHHRGIPCTQVRCPECDQPMVRK
jgi:hypothetical protein